MNESNYSRNFTYSGDQGEPASSVSDTLSPSTAHVSKNFRKYMKMFDTGLNAEMSVMFVGHTVGLYKFAIEWVRAQGVDCELFWNIEDGLAEVKKNSRDWSYCVIDIDGQGDIEAFLNTVATFRRALPQVPIILMSRDFQVNDFGCARLTVTDASLRLPLSISAFELAFEDALRNNKVWQLRSNYKS